MDQLEYMSMSWNVSEYVYFQAYYLAVPFPIEKAPTRKITDFSGGVVISEILKYPVRGLVFEGGYTLEDLSDAVSDSCMCLQDNNIPYNVLISDSGTRVFLLPQVSVIYKCVHLYVYLIISSSQIEGFFFLKKILNVSNKQIS